MELVPHVDPEESPVMLRLPANTLNINVSTSSAPLAPKSKKREHRRKGNPSCSSSPLCVLCKEAVVRCEPSRPAYACGQGCQAFCMHQDCVQAHLQQRGQRRITYVCSRCGGQLSAGLSLHPLLQPTQLLSLLLSTRLYVQQQGLLRTGRLLGGHALYLLWLCFWYFWLYGLAGKLIIIWTHGVSSQWQSFDPWGASVVMHYGPQSVEEGWWEVGRVHATCALSFWFLLWALRWMECRLGLGRRLQALLYRSSVQGERLFEERPTARRRSKP